MKRFLTIVLIICVLFNGTIYINASDIISAELETVEVINEDELMAIAADDECDQDGDGDIDEDDNDNVAVSIDGVTIYLPNIANGWTDHGARQAYNRDGHGVSNYAIRDAFNNPITVTQGSNNSTRYVGQIAEVCIGNDSGKVTICIGKTSQAWRWVLFD